MNTNKIKKFFNNKKLTLTSLILVCVLFLSACSFTDSLNKWLNLNNGNNNNNETVQEGDNDYDEVAELPNVKTNDNIVSNDRIEGKSLYWTKKTEVEEYYVAYYTSGVSAKLITVKTNEFNFSSLLTSSNIYAFRVGVEVDGVVELAHPVYYNPLNYQPYTNNVFYFDGNLGDHYITSQDEFNEIAHYAFINRSASFDLKFSSNYYSSLNGFASAKMLVMLNSAYGENLQETKSFSYNYEILSYSNKTMRIYGYYEDFAVPTEYFVDKGVVQNYNVLPYYETVNYEARATTYNDFASDKKVKLAIVSNSEELYWAVESGATPIFTQVVDNNGYTIYNQAKDILREIISDEMTDYEKLLSIFDWITINTVYDYKVVDSTALAGRPYMSFTSFYLEGVFFNGGAVCDGFSKAFSLMANMEGITTVRIVGDVQGQGHAWNKTYLNGHWYVVDITWTENTTNFYTNVNTEYFTHRFFLVADTDIPNHIPHSTQTYKNFAAPTNYKHYNEEKFTYDEETYSKNIATQDQFKAFFFNLLDNYFAQTTPKALGEDVVIAPSLSNIIFATNSTYIATLKQQYATIHGKASVNNAVLLIATEDYVTGYATASRILVISILVETPA